MKKMTTVFTVLLLAVFTMSLNAQTVSPQQQQQQGGEITDADLKKYAKVNNDLQKMQENSKAEQEKIIKDQGMKISRYSEIARAKQSGEEADMTAEEESKFEKISKKLRQYNKKNQQKAKDVLEKHSMDQRKFMQIRKKLSQDQELKKRLEAIKK